MEEEMEEEMPGPSLWDGGDYELFIALRGIFASMATSRRKDFGLQLQVGVFTSM